MWPSLPLAAKRAIAAWVNMKSGRKHIARQHPEHLIQLRQGAHNAARRLQRAAEVLPFVRVGDGNSL
jgi:hypothetical protein